MKRSRNRRGLAGVTLVELMVTMAIIGIISFAVTRAFIAGIDAERVFNRQQQEQDTTATLERHITRELQSALLTDPNVKPTDNTLYFVGEVGNVGTASGNGGTTTATPATTTTAAPTGSGQGGPTDATAGNLGCDRITFTTSEPGVPISAMTDSDDFETQQQKNDGPIGGDSEVSISITAIGDNPTGKTGLFERIQRPSDEDATQGGRESLLSADVKTIGFQFWDGAEWVQAWDTTTTPDTGRLPGAVLVSYTLTSDPTNKVHMFMVAIPSSNVTTLNPITQTSTGGG